MSSKTIYTSPLCSCIICKEVKSAKGIHSHYSSAHTESGKEHVRNAGAVGGRVYTENIKNSFYKKIEKWKQYYANPNKCLCCGNDIDWFKRHCICCSQKCSAVIANSKQSKESRAKQVQSLKQNIAKRKESNTYTTTKRMCYISFCVECGILIRNKNVKTCSEKCRSQILSRTAKNNPKMGGNKNTRAYGWYESSFAGRVWLESSYEYKVAVELDTNNINWTRPKYLPYGNGKKYFADFYLVDYDVYLDPKNDYLISIDTEKIIKVMEENSVKVIILDKNNLTWDKISKVLDTGFEPAMGN